MSTTQVPYFAFRDYPAGIDQQVEEALLGALRSQQYILGEAVEQFEGEFATYVKAGITIGVGNGYDALVVALKAAGIGAGDEVIVPANTFIATVNAVVQVGAIPVLAEPDRHTCNLTATEAAAHITSRTKAIIPVHLYGQACEMDGLMALAQQHQLVLIEDFAQAQGASYKGRPVGGFGRVSATSFYPTKNLGALGDGGAVVTSDPELAAYARMYRNYGQQQKYHNQIVGINSRLDTLQAAVLRIKLQHLDAMNGERQRLAQVYLTALQGIGDLVLPVTATGCTHVYHIFNIRSRQRDALQLHLSAQGIQTAIHYPVPVHLQEAYTWLGYGKGNFSIAEELAETSLSLPLFPGMTEAEQGAIIANIQTFFERHG
ncbi:DegT/DnrJ/EryC1/StrS family aminotransferase [uncultured Pontibacter sp.]|uniref:DegT/DnrJ/EryC1/StrS family aminotransferase n=1 Tax=uncultured Pontibacter sp. TaxID=453356 RepID=UPI0026189226|nr:DegT/DnrJ/EryC1/StrS family aminotransferase [uncultured Pontibacter sp.]